MANNTFEAAYMKLKNGMTLFFKDGGARELIDKLKALVDTKYGPDNPPPGAQNIWYAVCSTASGTGAKTATSSTGDFVLETGNMVRLKCTSSNTASNPTLSVDGSTPKTIQPKSGTSGMDGRWRAQEVIDLVYDGTSFVMSLGPEADTSFYGITKLSNNYMSTSQSLAATPQAVKSVYDIASAAYSSTNPPPYPVTDVNGQTGSVSIAVPSASSATPQDLGTADAGTSDDYSRADHVHNKPTYSKSDVGLENVDNVQQYSASNPPPYPVTDVNGQTGSVTVPGALYFTGQAVAATTGDICTISDVAITADYVLVSCVFANPGYITTDVTWTTSAGSLVLNGTCSTATTVSVVLVPKDN